MADQTKVLTTALGYVVGIYPWQGLWHVVAFNRVGNFRCASWHVSKRDARAARSRLFRLHRQIAKEREERRANRKSHANRCTSRVKGEACGTIMHTVGDELWCRNCGAKRRSLTPTTPARP